MKKNDIDPQIYKDWLEHFPELGKYHRNKFYKIIGPLVVGIELVDVPMMEQYRPFFFIYPLWETNVKSCFDIPLIYFEFYDKKKLDLEIVYRKHQQRFLEAVMYVKEQIPLPLNRDWHLSEVLRFAEHYLKTSRALHSGVRGQAIVRRFAVLLAVWVNDNHAVSIGLDVIQQEQKKWDRDQFVLWFGDFDAWYADLQNQVNQREDLFRLVQSNLQDSKLRKLPCSRLLQG